MMASQTQQWGNDGDLIDLNIASPELPRATRCLNHDTVEVADNLLDTELPVLEEKLLTTNGNLLDTDLPVLEENLLTTNEPIASSASSSRHNSIDIEDILISLDDGPLQNASPHATSRSNSEILFDLCETGQNVRDSLEVLSVLSELDQILNESLEGYDETINACPTSNAVTFDEDSKQSVEECLLELDNYLKALDVGGCDDCADVSSDSCFCKLGNCCCDSQSSLRVLDLNANSADSVMLNGDVLERKPDYQTNQDALHQIASGYVNLAYENTENNGLHKTESVMSARRPLSSCAGSKGEFIRNHLHRATVAGTGCDKPSFKRIATCQSVGELRPSCAFDRMSEAGVDSDEEIDWSWMQDVAHDVTLERRAHAAVDCCTGTVIVEPMQKDPMSSTAGAEDAVSSDRRGSSWLRNSMRRIRHLRLPSDVASSETENVATNTAEMITQRPVTLQRQSVVADAPVVRPGSAPSRLPTHTNVGTQSSVRERSRSRESCGSAVSREPGGRARSSSASSRSRRPRSLSSSESSLASSVDSIPSCAPAPTPTRNSLDQGATTNTRRSCDRSRPSDMPGAESPLGHWPHSLSSMLACLSCTLGLFNLSRFSILTLHFGANFIFQFFLLSVVIGLPLFTLQQCLGQQLGAGVIDMWRISPIFQGVGIALLLSQAFIGLYSIIGVSWMFVYFRDSFITKMDLYRWAEPFLYYRENVKNSENNDTYNLAQTVPDYFSGVVLQRHHLPSGNGYSTIKFQLAFNLAVVWMIVFVSLSKGLRSYGKVIYVFTLVPVFGTFVLCAKMLSMMPPDFVYVVFPETSWNEFFLNAKSWIAALQEVFLTWGLLGATVMQLASHNKHKHLLQRDSSLIAVITMAMLLLTAFLANTCVQLLNFHGFNYMPDSYEKMNSYTFLRPSKDPLPPSLSSTPVRYMPHHSFIVGERVTRVGVDYTTESGYQVLRLATELMPAAFAILGTDRLSPFWAVLFYFILILFGIAQQLAIWHCVITGIMAIKAKLLKSWETTITFFSCACGYLLGLPMATEFGIYVVYFMDFTIGGVWWLIMIILLQIVAVFMVRGRPYSGDTVVTALFTSPTRPCILSWAPAMLSFIWNVVLPVTLMVFCIVFFKNGNFKELFVWHHAPSVEYWPLWARQVGALIQLLPILIVPAVAIIQSYRYLNSGPPDILERVQLLYRPPIGDHMDDAAVQQLSTPSLNNTSATTIPAEDPPPKYTPPPSYTTATGARIAKFLRQSIRRSVRRITNALGESSRQRNVSQNDSSQLPPPDYSTVIVEMNQSMNQRDLNTTISDNSVRDVESQELPRNNEIRSLSGSSVLTAADVACILRRSFRRSTIRPSNTLRRGRSDNTASLSVENLVDSAAPIGQTSLVLENLSNNDTDIKPASENFSSVI